MILAPIVLFVYNRPWHTRQTVEALQKNDLAKDSDLFIYSDAAKDESTRNSVDEVRSYIEDIDGFKSITIIKREKNWGLAKSIIDGVTNIVNRYDKIIVLEDDLVTSKYFLKFMNKALEFYEDKKRVWHISGYTPPFDKKNITKHFFIYPTSCWGWGTWSKNWSFFKKDSKYFMKNFDRNKIYDFNIKGSYPYYSHIVLNHKNKIDTWAIFWYASVFLHNGLSLHPINSYVQNIGFDKSGTHCGENCNFKIKLENNYNSALFPSEILVENSINENLSIYYKGIKKSFFSRIKDKIKKIFMEKNKR